MRSTKSRATSAKTRDIVATELRLALGMTDDDDHWEYWVRVAAHRIDFALRDAGVIE